MKLIVLVLITIIAIGCGPTLAEEPSGTQKQPTSVAEAPKPPTVPPTGVPPTAVPPTPLPPTPVPPTATPATRAASISPTTTPAASPAPTAQAPTPVAINTRPPTPEPTWTPMPTSAVTPVPTASPIHIPTPVPTVTATPTQTSTPAIQTTPLPNIFDEFGFTLALDEDASFSSSKLVISGMSGDDADRQQGLLTFEYNGSDIVMFWLSATDDPPAAMIESTYQLLKVSQPSNILTPVSDGDIVIDDEPGRFGGFVASDSSRSNVGGGLLAAWTCQELGITLSLIVTGLDPTTLQIRFDRLTSGFKCN